MINSQKSIIFPFLIITISCTIYSCKPDPTSNGEIKSAIDYINRIAELCEVPIKVVSVGPERHQVVTL